MTITMDAPSARDAPESAGLPRGYRVEITDGKIITTPQEGRSITVRTDGFPRTA
ncbi:hypothetical protein ACF1G0_21510 [Streptomyces sp. NPDC013953]|uniref:hypothetical protein n=1 Tax=Streptomyces sp. NPDC013953 TaxID=3364868 RepID=UPI00370187C0